MFRLSVETGQTIQTITTPFRPEGFGSDVTEAGLVFGDGALWALGKSVNYGGRPLYKIDVAAGQIAETFATAFKPAGLGPDVGARGLVFGDGYLWAFGDPPNTASARPLYKLDPKNGKLLETRTTSFKTPGVGTALANIGFAFGEGHLWGFGYPVNGGARPLYQIDPANRTISKTIFTSFKAAPLGTDVASLGLAYGGGSLWAFGYAVNNGARPLYRISPADGKISQTISTLFRGQPGADVADVGLAYVTR